MPASHSKDPLHILSGIQPAEFCRLVATLSLAYHGSLDHDHILYGLLSGSSNACQERLRSRLLFMPAARNLLKKTLPNLASALLSGQIIDRMQSIQRIHPGSVFSYPGSPSPLERACPEQLELSSIACELVSGDSILPCPNGISFLHQIACTVPLKKP